MAHQLTMSVFPKIVLFAFFISGVSFSQNTSNEYEKITNEWKNKSFDEITAEYKLSWSDSLKGPILFALMRDIAERTQDPDQRILVYHTESYLSFLDNDYQRGISQIEKAVEILQKIGDNSKYASIIYSLKGVHLFRSGDYEAAMTNYLKAYELVKKTGNIQREMSLSHNIALLKVQTNNVKDAQEIHLKNLQTLDKKPELAGEKKDFLIDVLTGVIRSYIDLGEYDKGLRYCEKLEKESKQFENIEGTFYAYAFYSDIYSLTEKYNRSLFYIAKCEESIFKKEIDDIVLIVYIHLYKARSLFGLERYEEVLDELLKIEELKEESSIDHLGLEEMYALFAKSYQKLGDLNKATMYFDKSLEVFEKNKQFRRKLNGELFNKYDLGGLKDEITILSIKSARQKKQLYSSITIGSILLIGFFIFHRSIRVRNKRKFEELISQLNEYNNESKNDSFLKKSKEYKIEDEKAKEIIKRLEQFEMEEIYLKQDLTLTTVAKKLATNTSYLSKVVNQYKGLSFTKYLTELRLNYVMNRLKNDSRFRSYTVKAIAYEIGFKSPEPFAKAFKKKTGIYPSYFIRELNK